VPPDYGIVAAPRTNFLPMRNLSTVFWREMVWRHVVSHNGLGEPLPGKVAHRGVPDARVAAGNHAVGSRSLGPTEPGERMTILHFPYRSLAQYQAKIDKGGRALENNKKAGPEMFHVWRQHHRLQRKDHLETWYQQLPHGDDPIREEMVRRGEVVEDRRLKIFMENLERTKRT
jgi:hypothetical protein